MVSKSETNSGVLDLSSSHREVSAQEAAYRIRSLPLKQLSRIVVFINTASKEDRVSLIAKAHQPDQRVCRSECELCLCSIPS